MIALRVVERIVALSHVRNKIDIDGGGDVIEVKPKKPTFRDLN